ncbi:hypothetical protein NXV39_20135 [Parabacteroides distasonis]|uniref:hypothetical protein n=1 Tax=Parabacteroides distasonis TaxID=823 RepID=UPI002165F963|nr:hypothetical protein [Parabacteroides distasonis]MCS3227685.1 hypothetical protein [Parabacteroides distasonis]
MAVGDDELLEGQRLVGLELIHSCPARKRRDGYVVPARRYAACGDKGGPDK